jgi:hypothetical protein
MLRRRDRSFFAVGVSWPGLGIEITAANMVGIQEIESNDVVGG